MKTKKCSRCKELKPKTQFYIRKGGVLGCYCRLCDGVKSREYNRSLNGCIKNMYRGMCRRSIIRKHPPPNFSMEEFVNWLYLSTNFKQLYRNWVSSGYDKNLAPSPDRLDNNLHYTFENIKLVTWKINRINVLKDIKDGNVHVGLEKKPIVGKHKKNGMKVEFISITEAAKELRINKSNICQCCRGNLQSAGGYSWEYK